MSKLGITPDKWHSSNGGVVRNSHIATGVGADIDSAGASLALSGATITSNILNQETSTNTTSGVVAGVINNIIANPGVNSSQTWVGQDGVLEVKSGNAVNFTGTLYGDLGGVYHFGSGTISLAAGLQSVIANDATGIFTAAHGTRTIGIFQPSGVASVGSYYGYSSLAISYPNHTVTDNFGMRLFAPIMVGGTITNNYGLYIESQTAGSTLNYNIYSAGATSKNYFEGQVTLNSSGGTLTPLIVEAATNTYTFEYRKSDGTNLLKGVWDTGNFHHYLGGSLYYNLSGNNFVIDGNGYSNTGLIISNKAQLKLDAGITGDTNIYFGGGSYATAGTPLTVDKAWTMYTWAWNGSNGYTLATGSSMYQIQNSTTNGDASIHWQNNAAADVLVMNLLNKYVGASVAAPHSTLHSGGSFATSYVAKTGTYSITDTDSTIDCTSGTFTVTLPTAASIAGRQYTIKNSGTGVITIATTSAQTIDGASNATLSTQYSSLTVQSNGSNWILI